MKKPIFASLLSSVFTLSLWAETRVSVMTYNVENLFDTEDDPRVQDETYLPLSKKHGEDHKKKCKKASGFGGGRVWDCLFLDWNAELLDAKMKNLAEQILKAPGGKGPDILILTEVENRTVVGNLNLKYLSKAGYTVTHMDSADERGIDQAILSRYPLKGDQYKYHQIAIEKKSRSKKAGALPKRKDLRGILQGVFEVAGKTVNVLALHLPSQGASFREREAVLNELNRIVMRIPANELVIAAGDFNISAKEWEKEKVYPNYLQDIWTPAHLQGCKQCQGTYHYRKEWSYLDLLLLRFDREKKARWRWDGKSVQAISGGRSKYPTRFDPHTRKGASDHFPLYAELILE